MCGITGFVDYKNRNSRADLEKMVDVLSHRGPDDNGVEIYRCNTCQVGLGHARLSIIDVSSSGHQPMSFENLTITYNGEIYNYIEIREELISLGHKFKTNSDTEVILHAYKQWKKEAVHKFIGMFAFAIYDKKSQELVLFRDRAGVKPLYYFVKDNIFLFSSELKSFYSNPEFPKEIDNKSLGNYFNFGYIPAPNSIFKDTFKLQPGHILTYSLSKNSYSIAAYWKPRDFYSRHKLTISYDEAKHDLKVLLLNAFQYRMVADVPVGVFLSGGYDSTAVAALLQENMTNKLKTFTIGFKEGNNEAPHAKQTAELLGTDHYEYVCTTKEAQDIISDLPFYYDEPFADSSAIPTILVSKLARQYVTVALSADAGDEIFSGYNSYTLLRKYLGVLNKIPNSLKNSSIVSLNVLSKLLPGNKISLRHKIQGIYKSLNQDELLQGKLLFKYMNSLPKEYNKNLFNEEIKFYSSSYDTEPVIAIDSIENAMLTDYQMYLSGDILTKVDRASMSVSLEGREPLLDHRIFEFVSRLPLQYKLDSFTGKRILKDIVHDYIPYEMMNRPKTGFSIPLKSWLQGDLSFLINEFLSEESLAKSEIFNSRFVKKKIDLFKRDKLHYVPFIWKILMFQMWYFKWMR